MVKDQLGNEWLEAQDYYGFTLEEAKESFKKKLAKHNVTSL